MSHGRTYDREFKIAIVHAIMRGDQRISQICRQHGLNERVVLRWRTEVAERGDAAFLPQLSREADAQAVRIAELERLVGQLTLENTALKKGLQHARLASVTG